MSGGLYIGGDTSGSVLLYPTPVAGATTITIAAQSGTLNVAGPAFSAYPSSGTSVPTATSTKLVWDTEYFDTAGCFNNTGSTVTLNGISVPSYSFAPNVAGYYQISANTRFGSFTSNQCYLRLYKNGSLFIAGGGSGVSAGYVWPTLSTIIYLNGTSDYVDVQAYQTSGSTQSSDYTGYYVFSGCFLRGA